MVLLRYKCFIEEELIKWVDNECKFDGLLFSGHDSIATIMTARLKNLSVVARHWGDGEIKVREKWYLISSELSCYQFCSNCLHLFV